MYIKVEVLTGPNLSTPAHYSGTAVYVLVFNSALAYKGAYQRFKHVHFSLVVHSRSD